MEEQTGISIIGAGKVGTALGVLAARAGWRVVCVASRSDESAKRAAEAIGHGAEATSIEQAAAGGDVVLLTVPDGAVEALCERLAGASAFGEGAVVAHCSGALTSESLEAARQARGCAVASMHPLQTFPTVRAAVEKLPGAFFFLEGDGRAVRVLEHLAESVGGRCVRIEPRGKALYHAASVMACNYLAALIDAALSLARAAEIDENTALKALAPLVRATTENVLTMGPVKALTGPIERGDRLTVERHAKAIRLVGPDLARLYRTLGERTLALALKKGSIDETTASALREALAEANEP